MLNFQTPEGPQFAVLRAEVIRIVAESGVLKGFDPDSWLKEWLDSPNPALGDVRPRSLLDSPEGLQNVLGVLRCMQSAAYR